VRKSRANRKIRREEENATSIQTAFTLFQKQRELSSLRRGDGNAFETPGVEPVFLDQEQAIDYAQSRTRA